MNAEQITAAYAECERITGERARNFAWGIRLLPPVKRRALSAVYAAARRVDDIGDGDWPAERKLGALGDVRKAITEPGEHPDDPVLIALADAAGRLPIPLDAFHDLVDGCEADVTGYPIRSRDELVQYCRWVAGSIGRLSLGVFAPPLPPEQWAEADRLADALGVALQMTNILRDIREDAQMDRVYVPQDDLDLFSCRIEFDADGCLDAQGGALSELIRFEAARAWSWYDDGLRLLAMLDRRSAACAGAMAGIYSELLNRIARHPDRVRRERVSLPATDKIRVATRALLAGGRHVC